MERAAAEAAIDRDVVVGPATVRRLQLELSRRGIERLGVRAVGAGCGRIGDGVNLLRFVDVKLTQVIANCRPLLGMARSVMGILLLDRVSGVAVNGGVSLLAQVAVSW